MPNRPVGIYRSVYCLTPSYRSSAFCCYLLAKLIVVGKFGNSFWRGAFLARGHLTKGLKKDKVGYNRTFGR